jgi:hypothetical protein
MRSAVDRNIVILAHTCILQLQFMVNIMLFPVLSVVWFYISALQTVCLVLYMAVFGSFLISCFPITLFSYFPDDFEAAPIVLIIVLIPQVLYFCCEAFLLYLLLLLLLLLFVQIVH